MLGNWLSNFSDKERRVMLVGAAHCVGLFGDVVMILFLTKSSVLHLYMLFSGGPTGCAYGCTYSIKI